MIDPTEQNRKDFSSSFGRPARMILGETWPDWWADLVTAMKVITINRDDRLRGGPDMAVIWTPDGLIFAKKGDEIRRYLFGTIAVVPADGPTAQAKTDEAPL